jgi:hypothetical protein
LFIEAPSDDPKPTLENEGAFRAQPDREVLRVVVTGGTDGRRAEEARILEPDLRVTAIAERLALRRPASAESGACVTLDLAALRIQNDQVARRVDGSVRTHPQHVGGCRSFRGTTVEALVPQGSGGALADDRRELLGRGGRRVDPRPPVRVEHSGKAVHTLGRVNAALGVVRDTDSLSTVLPDLRHPAPGASACV